MLNNQLYIINYPWNFFKLKIKLQCYTQKRGYFAQEILFRFFARQAHIYQKKIGNSKK
jgi:hypothetical protein